MRSSQLIAALTADQRRGSTPARSIAIAVFGGTILAAVVFAWDLGVRPDVATAMKRADFLFKFVVTLAVAVPAVASLVLAMRPGGRTRKSLLAIGPIVLALGVGVELLSTPAGSWGARAIGSNAVLCLLSIPVLALAPFFCLLYAARSGAPARPGVAGALCGLAAASIGAFLYAAHCPDDSPLFVAVWYTTAIVLATLAGTLIGARWLRW